MIEMHVTITHTLTGNTPNVMKIEYSRIKNLNEARSKVRYLALHLTRDLASDQRVQLKAQVLKNNSDWITIYNEGQEYELI